MCPPYKIVFCGTPFFAVPSLMKLHQHPNLEVGQVFSQPDRRAGRGQRLQPSPVKKAALELNLACETPENISNPQVIKQIKAQGFQMGVIVAYGQILSQEFLKAFPLGCVNLHSSLLPRWRGAAPMERALMEGDPKTGVSLQKVVKQLDAGDLIAHEEMDLPLEMGAKELHSHLSEKGAQLLEDHLIPFMKGDIHPLPQDETLVTWARKIQKQEALVDWKKPALDIHNQIRAFNRGEPFAFTHFKGQALKLHKSRHEKQPHLNPPGQIRRTGKKLLCGGLWPG